MAEILVVKLADIGDVLTITPALRALRRSLPAARITVLATPGAAPALDGLPYLDEALLFDKFRYDRPWDALRPAALANGRRFFADLRARHVDTVIILHHLTTRWGACKYATLALASGAPRRLGLDNGRGWFLSGRVHDEGFGARHEADYWLQVVGLLGAETADRRLEMAVPAEARAWARSRLPLGRSCYVAVHPGSGGYITGRRWPPERFAQVADALAAQFALQPVLVGGPGEEALAAAVQVHMARPALNLSGQTGLKQLAALLERCLLFVGGDSGVMHVAAAAGASIVALFGPTNEAAWGPYVPPGSGQRAVVVRAPGAAATLYVGRTLGERRAFADTSAMLGITTEMVLAAARRILAAQCAGED